MIISVLVWIMPASFLLVGLGLLTKGLLDLRKARQTLQWPTVPGVITRSEVKVTSDSDSDSYAPVVEYTYAVNRREYHSTSLWAGPRVSATPKFAKTITARYPLGQAVTVFHNPAKPESALLEPGKTKFAWIYVGGGGLLILLAFALMLVFTLGQ